MDAMEAGFPIEPAAPQKNVALLNPPAHQFFIATLFQPQLSSTAKKRTRWSWLLFRQRRTWSRRSSTIHPA